MRKKKSLKAEWRSVQRVGTRNEARDESEMTESNSGNKPIYSLSLDPYVSTYPFWLVSS